MVAKRAEGNQESATHKISDIKYQLVSRRGNDLHHLRPLAAGMEAVRAADRGGQRRRLRHRPQRRAAYRQRAGPVGAVLQVPDR
ncbi:hypothetical protein G6F24_016486 [Rhizopus arrhizus]|nr:hypothetical protein G6F24_016486 [Rhizopus arrhizus]